MMIPPYVFYLALVIGVPVLGLIIERLVRLHLRKRVAPDAVQRGASHVIVCATLWAVHFLYHHFYPGPDWVATLVFFLLAIVSPIFSLLNLLALARMRIGHPAKRLVSLFCMLNFVGVVGIWILKNRELKWW
jgi:hypothetical protein